MAITLASDSLSDAAVTDGIGRGDLAAAARLWVRYWPSALASARLYVDRPEVPGLAAEALIGTISMTALGRGPREDVAGFVAAAVRELGADDEPPAADGPDLPEVFTSPRMTRSFAALPDAAQQALRADGGSEDDFAPALTVLQTSYLTTHLDEAPSSDCRRTHIALMGVAEGGSTEAFAAGHWLHMSTCAWCTEAFHELAFSNLALAALVAPAVFAAGPAPVPTPVVEESPEAILTAEAEPEAEPESEPDTAHRARVPALLQGSRNRLLAVAAVTAAAALVGVVVTQNLSGNDDGTAAAATTEISAHPTTEADSTDGTDANGFDGSLESPDFLPTATVAGPLAVATPTGTPEADGSPTRTAASKPTKKPDPSPSSAATTAPATRAPTPTPTPSASPSASPTRACNPLQHLLGFC